MREERLYLLRLWRDSDRVEDWRCSLENVRTKEQQVFVTFEALYAFLEARAHPSKATTPSMNDLSEA